MEDFVTLVKQGVIYDGCSIVAKGTVRIKGGDICIESMHNLMALDGKNFADLCEPGRTEQGQLVDRESQVESWKTKAEELEKEKELVSNDMNKKISELQGKLQQEYALRTVIQEHLEREKSVSADASHAIREAQSKLTSKVEELQQLQRQLEAKDDLIQDLQSQLESARELLVEREQKMEALVHQLESLQGKLDSSAIMLGEKEEKLHNLQNTLKEWEGKQREVHVVAEGLRDQVNLLEADRMEEKRNSVVLLDDFGQWRTNAADEIASLKKELEKNRTTITTLKNELEIADLEENEYHTTINTLQKENEALRTQLKLSVTPTEAEPVIETRQRRSQSLRNLLKSVSKPKEKDPNMKETKKEKKDKRNSVASNPAL